MTHLDTGNYAAKHTDSLIPENLRRKVVTTTENSRLNCAKAHQLALETGFSPAEVGRALDLLEIRLTGCQLGLFGQSREKKKLETGTTPSPELCETLQAGIINHCLPCLKAWETAISFNLKKTEITAACETLKIKIAPCQLGAF